MQKINIFSWFDRSTVKHLRLPFSFFLMPVFVFALSQANEIRWSSTIIAFLILHVLVFPSSNGYNSFQDKDTGSIGGLKHPPQISRNLYRVTLLMDIIAVLAGLWVSYLFSFSVLIFILMSRAYSYRNIRLKKYPVIGFLTVFIFQGAFVYFMTSVAATPFIWENIFSLGSILCMVAASFFMGSVYPLTQIYQHEADKNDGVISLSYRLGYNGTFIFSAVLFVMASALLFYHFMLQQQPFAMVVFLVMLLPVIVFLSVWFAKVRKSHTHANFENTMKMNLLTSTSMNLYFLVLLFNNYFNWF